MAILDRRAAWLLIVVLALTALVGFSQGLARALGAPRPEQPAAGVDPIRDPVPNASPLTGPVLDEGRIRQIAREEAVAALGASVRRKAPSTPKPEERDEDAAAPMSPAGASASTATAAPAAGKPTAQKPAAVPPPAATALTSSPTPPPF